MLHARGALRLAVRRRDPLVGAMMWAHDAQVHMLVLPAQTANSENHVLTSCGTRVRLQSRNMLAKTSPTGWRGRQRRGRPASPGPEHLAGAGDREDKAAAVWATLCVPLARLLSVSPGHLVFVCGEGAQNLPLLPLGHLEDVKRSRELGRDLVELGGRDLQLAVRFLQAERSAARYRGDVLLRATGNVADPQGAHEFEARKSAQIVGVPLAEVGVLRLLADDGVLHDRVAEVVNHRCDGEYATEPVVKGRFRHCLPPEG